MNHLILNTKEWIDNYRKLVFKKIPPDLLLAEHTEKKHFYRHKTTGKLFSSVTAPLGVLNIEHLKMWSANIASQYVVDNWDDNEDKVALQKRATKEHYLIFRDSGDVGTLGHDIGERYCKEWIETGQKPEDIKTFIDSSEQDPRVYSIALSIQNFFNDTGAIPVFSELNVAVTSIQIAGQLDLIVLMPTKIPNQYNLILVDLKTSNSSTHDTYALQTSVYFQGFKELTGKDSGVAQLKRIMILGLGKEKPKYEINYVPHIRSSYATYKRVLDFYRWRENTAVKKVVKKINLNAIKI